MKGDQSIMLITMICHSTSSTRTLKAVPVRGTKRDPNFLLHFGSDPCESSPWNHGGDGGDPSFVPSYTSINDSSSSLQ